MLYVFVQGALVPASELDGTTRRLVEGRNDAERALAVIAQVEA